VQRQRTVLGYAVVTGPTKTANGSREVMLDAETVAVLRSWRVRLASDRLSFGPGYVESGYVFVDEDGEAMHPERIGKAFAKLVKITGARGVRLHNLRHGNISNQLNVGADIFAVSKGHGHATAAFTMTTYGHLSRQRARAVAEAGAAYVPRKARP
jgi:integrase